MSISIEWDEHLPYVLYKRYEGAYTWEQAREYINKDYAMTLEVAPHIVDLIIHYVDRDAQVPPLGSLANWRLALQHDPPNRGVIVMVPANRIIRTHIDLARRFIAPPLSGRFMSANTLDETYVLLREIKAARESGID